MERWSGILLNFIWKTSLFWVYNARINQRYQEKGEGFKVSKRNFIRKSRFTQRIAKDQPLGEN